MKGKKSGIVGEANVHAVTVFYDNPGGGWRFECSCGFTTPAWTTLRFAGEEMDEHLDKFSGTSGFRRQHGT